MNVYKRKNVRTTEKRKKLETWKMPLALDFVVVTGIPVVVGALPVVVLWDAVGPPVVLVTGPWDEVSVGAAVEDVPVLVDVLQIRMILK